MEIIDIELDPVPITEELLPEMVKEFPWRSACTVPEGVKDYIEGKFVCDIGCAEGDMLYQFSKVADRVKGIELDSDRFRFAKERGLDVICGNMFRIKNFPIADVYYLWGPSPEASMNMVSWVMNHPKVENCFVLSGGRENANHVEVSVNKFNGKVLAIPYKEYNYNLEREEEGKWWVGVVEKKAGVHV